MASSPNASTASPMCWSGRLGLVPGNRVLLRSANKPMFVAAYLAVMKAGGVAVATMPLLRAKELALPIDFGGDQPRALRRAARGRTGAGPRASRRA